MRQSRLTRSGRVAGSIGARKVRFVRRLLCPPLCRCGQVDAIVHKRHFLLRLARGENRTSGRPATFDPPASNAPPARGESWPRNVVVWQIAT